MRWLCLLVLVACHETIAPRDPFVGRYVLVTCNGAKPSCVLSVIPPEVYRLDAQVVWLHGDSTYADTAIATTDASPFYVQVDTFVNAGQWSPDTMLFHNDTLTRTIQRGAIGLPDVVLKLVRQH